MNVPQLLPNFDLMRYTNQRNQSLSLEINMKYGEPTLVPVMYTTALACVPHHKYHLTYSAHPKRLLGTGISLSLIIKIEYLANLHTTARKGTSTSILPIGIIFVSCLFPIRYQKIMCLLSMLGYAIRRSMATEDSKADSRTVEDTGFEGALKALPPLTEKQAECLKFVLNYFIEHKFYPTQREVAAAMNINSKTADSYFVPLIRKGYLKKERPGSRRNIELTSIGVKKLEMMGVNARERLLAD
jgi:predicted transcriptional regulator